MINKKCPKCGSREFQIAENFSVDTLYEVKDFMVYESNVKRSVHLHTTCTCHKCKHKWHPRNIEYTIDGKL